MVALAARAVLQKTVTLSPRLKQNGRGRSRQFPALVCEMRLVGVSRVGRNARELVACAGGVERTVQPQHTHEQLRPVSDGGRDSAPQLALAEGKLLRQPPDRQRRIGGSVPERIDDGADDRVGPGCVPRDCGQPLDQAAGRVCMRVELRGQPRPVAGPDLLDRDLCIA